MTGNGPREIVLGEQDGVLVEADAPLSDPTLAEHLGPLEEGARVEVGLAAAAWIRAAASLERGFLLLFDYGHEAAQLQWGAGPRGTLMAYRGHRADDRHWLTAPGETDLTAHVDLTAVRRVAEAAG